MIEFTDPNIQKLIKSCATVIIFYLLCWLSFTVPIVSNYGPRSLAFEPNAPGGGSLILYITHWTVKGDKQQLDSTCIYELTKDGSWTGNKCMTNTSANGRIVCVNPDEGEYWVDGFQHGPIQKIRGFYPQHLLLL